MKRQNNLKGVKAFILEGKNTTGYSGARSVRGVKAFILEGKNTIYNLKKSR